MRVGEIPLKAPLPIQSGASSGAWANIRAMIFPLLTNFWPVLLFVSQKVFVIPAIILAGFGDGKYRRDLLLSAIISLVGIVVYVQQYGNAYDQVHLLGFLLFAWSMPTLNYATRLDPTKLRRFLTYLTLLNAAIGFFLLVSKIDLYGLRGLNQVIGSDGLTHRVYFESTSLATVLLISTFRWRWAQVAMILAVFGFVLFVAKSVVIAVLFGLNLALPYILRSSPAVKVITVGAIAVVFTILFIYLPVLRPDVDLSLQAKQYQFDLIINSLGNGWSGLGWGAYYPQLASDPEQPYQVEMQLPMLLLQLGPIALFAILGATLALFLSATRVRLKAFARFAIYALIGFNNPWLFVPSWFLTCQLLFRYENDNE